MKTRSTIFTKAILCVLIAALTLVIYIPAAAATNTTLTTEVPKTLPLFLKLSGNGTVMVKDIAYNQSQTIEIPRNTTFELQVKPSAGNKIESVFYGGLDYTEEAKSGKITLPAMTSSANISVCFSKILQTPQTGDSYSLFHWILLMVLSLIGIIAILIPQKKELR